MANTIVLPYTPVTYPRTARRHQWRRSTTTMTMQTDRKLLSSSCSLVIHNSTPNLPDLVNDCHNRRSDTTMMSSNSDMKLLCKEIAHSLRTVADQIDRKYCQDADFGQDLQFFSIRLYLQSTHFGTIIYTLWTRSILPFILLICKAKQLF